MNVYAIPGLVEVQTEERILQKVCERYDVAPEVVMKKLKSRKREFVEIRMICMYLFRKQLKQSYYAAGGFFLKEHATAMHAVKTVDALLECNKDFRKRVTDIIDL